jgi:hypothetical protein
VLAVVLLLGVVTVVWARGGWDGRLRVVADRSTPSSVLPTPTTDPPVEPTTTSREGGPVLRVIQWINKHAPLGGGATGLADEAFAAMLEGDCRGVLRMMETSAGEVGEPVKSVYDGAAAACLAAFEGQPELWPRAEAAAARVGGRASRLACEEQTVYRLLGRLLDAHRADPDARLTRGPVGPRGVLTCPRFTGITPDHGPAQGGYPVRITGEHLPRTVGVNFGPDQHAQAEVEDGQLTVTVPPAPASSPTDPVVVIWPDGALGWSASAAVEFTYDRPGTSGPSTPTTMPSTTTDPPSTSSTTAPPPSS